MGEALTPLSAERRCPKTLANSKLVAICMKKSKCWILHQGWDNPGSMYRWRIERLESSPRKGT